jgi:DNA-binding response OmpR family regulator
MSRILIIEDEDTLGDALSSVLQDEGHETFLAMNGQEGLKLLEETRPHLVILDLMLPIVEGTEVLEQRSETARDVPVVVISSASRELLQDQAVTAFLEKPFTLESLLSEVERALGTGVPSPA